jgi:uncharacterized protein (DUF2235 family)
MRKTIVILADGTSKTLKSMTNVSKIAAAIKGNAVVYYDRGVGTEPNNTVLGSVVGKQVDNNVLQCYEFLALNYSYGDTVILVGYSRGAYTVRSLAGLIHNSGVPSKNNIHRIDEAMAAYRSHHKPSSPEMNEFRKGFGVRIRINLMLCFDTVGSIVGQKFHNTEINKYVQKAIQFAAYDEDRDAFSLVPMDAAFNTETIWYKGDHGCIGGGYKKELEPLSNIPLKRAVEELILSGVDINMGDIKTDPSTKFSKEYSGVRFFTSIFGRSKRVPKRLDKFDDSVIFDSML